MMNIQYGQSPLLFLNSLIFCYSLGVYGAEKYTLPHKCLFLLLIVNFCLAVYLMLKKHHLTFVPVMFIFLLLGQLTGSAAFSVSADNISRWENKSLTLEGTVCEEPSVRQDNSGIYHLSYIIDTQKIIRQNQTQSTRGKIYIYKKQKNLSSLAKIGDTVSVSGTLRQIHGYHNPGQINRELRARQLGIYGFISAGKADINIIKPAAGFNLNQFSANLRHKILNTLLSVMPSDDAYMIFAMLFGGYSNIPAELLEAFSLTGIIHILSVSGSHISLIAGFLLSLGRLFRLPRSLNLLLLIIIISFYAFLCGCTAPVIRAAVMGILTAAALTLQKSHEAAHLLSITALIMLLISPLLLFDISFQLSFASTAGLIYLMSFFRQKLHFLPRFIADNIALTASAQIMTLPLIAWYFNSLSPSSLIANLIAVPLLEFIIILSLSGCLILFLPFIAKILFISSSLILGLANMFTLHIAALPFASVYIPTLPFICVAVYYLILFIIFNRKAGTFCWKIIRRYRFGVAALSLISLLFSAYLIFKPHDLQIHFIDVGQGDCILVITPQHKAVMIDTGGSVNSDFDIGARVDLPYLRHYGITKLDYLILSHADADHAAGAYAIMQKIPVNHFIIANQPLKEYRKVLKLPPDNQILNQAVTARTDMQFTLDGVQFQFLRANENPSLNTGNAASNVLKLSYHNFSALLTGDLPEKQEQELIQNRSDLQSTVLKIAHHGSKTSSSAEFLQNVKPRFAVISVGKYNSFNHPSPEVIERLDKLQIPIYRTDTDGAIIFSTNGYKMKIDTFS